jgi:hypothetical protein
VRRVARQPAADKTPRAGGLLALAVGQVVERGAEPVDPASRRLSAAAAVDLAAMWTRLAGDERGLAHGAADDLDAIGEDVCIGYGRWWTASLHHRLLSPG